MNISKHKAVTIHYTLTNDAGEVLDTSEGGHPFAYIQGIGTIVPGLENALEGKASGDSLKVSIQPEDGYGRRNEAMVDVVPREAFGNDVELEVGMYFQASKGEEQQVFMITRIEGEEITVDANHPLADVPLNFDVNIVDVRDATKEELEHGHIHGPGGHEH